MDEKNITMTERVNRLPSMIQEEPAKTGARSQDGMTDAATDEGVSQLESLLFLLTMTIGLVGCGAYEATDADASASVTMDANTDAAIGVSTDAGKNSFVFASSTSSPSFFDDFLRANGPIGNGWLDKTSAFSLVDGVVLQNVAGNPDERVVLRPEGFFDVEVSALLSFESATTEASLFAREQVDSTAFEAYRLMVQPTRLNIELRCVIPNGVCVLEIASTNISPSLVNGRTYRTHLRVRGKDPVSLEGGLFTAEGDLIASVRATDTSSSRLVAPGRVGFGSRAVGTRWDDFRYWTF